MIEVRQLQYTYPKTATKALKGIDFDIRAGEVFGFLGPSGSGKTTTQGVLIGLLKGYQGEVSIMGRERHAWNRSFYERVGVAFDYPNLYNKLTARENLRIVQGYYRGATRNADELLERVGLLPDADRRVEAYSKGMKMRLNFVRALLHDPELLFLDEPTSGLDPVNAKVIKDMILEMKTGGKTVFLTTHNMTVAEQLCDRVAFLVDGNIPLLDAPDALKVRYGGNRLSVKYLENNRMEETTFPLLGLEKETSFYDLVQTGTIRAMHSQEATLEEIFIRVTGRELI